MTADDRTTGEKGLPAEHDARPVRVLVADDHPLWREALVQDLTEAGMEVVGTAADGAAAVRRTRATTPDVLLLDLNLPELDGAQVCAEVAGLPTRVLILSASGEERDVLAAMKAAAARGAPAPRLLSGPEQDVVLGELLRGHQDEGTGPVWPPRCASAVGTRGFRQVESRDRRAVGDLASDRPKPCPEHPGQASAPQQGRVDPVRAGARAALTPTGIRAPCPDAGRPPILSW